MVFEIADVVGRLGICMTDWAVIEYAVDWARVAVDVSELSETVFRDIVLWNGQSVVVKSELRYCRHVSSWFEWWSWDNGVCERDSSFVLF